MSAGPSNELPVKDLMENLMKDPFKRALVLQLINKEKDNLEKYRRQELKKQTTPIKTRKLHCESPTALQRRRALEQRNIDTTSESSSSDMSEVLTEVRGPKLPFEQLLKGVKAYVEVKRDNEDRSEGIKAVMKLMGATVKEKFTNDVTHVIFKDGSFTTFEKAKLMKIHLVSVLWLDAVRRHNARVPEKNYPAFGNRVCDANVSVLCSQIQKDYEEVIKDERRRRHTMMASKTSMSSYITAQNIAGSDDESIGTRTESPELTSDDSNCGVIDGHSSKPSKNLDLLLKTNSMNRTTNDSSGHLESSGSISLLSHINKNRRKTSHVVSDMQLTPTVDSIPQTKSSEEIIEPTPTTEDKLTKVLPNSSLQSSTMSSLRISIESDKTKSGLGNSKDSSRTKSSLATGKENCSATTVHTTMSSLRLSDSLDKKSSEETSKSSRSSSRLTPSNKQQQIASLSSNSSTDKVTVRARRTRRTKSPESEELAKELNDTSMSASESKDQTPEKKIGSRSKNTSLNKQKRELAADVLKELNQLNVDLNVSSKDKTTKKNNKEKQKASLSKTTSPNISPAKRLQSSLSNSSESDLEDRKQLEKANTSKRDRRATSVMPQTKPAQQTTSRSRRSTSVLLMSSVDDTNRRRSRRISVAKSPESDMDVQSEENNPEFIHPKNVRTKKRATSVVSASSGQSSNNVHRSLSADRTASVDLARLEQPFEDSKKSKKLTSVTPSPAKKTRVEASSSVKKRKLYNPQDVAFTPPAEEKEREEHQKQKSQKSPEDEDVFVNPNDINIVPVRTRRKSGDSSDDLSDWSCGDSETNELKKTLKKWEKNQKQNTPKRNSADDEQRELLELLNRATTTGRRQSNRLCLTQPKTKYSSTSSDTSSLPITPLKRRSTLDFVSLTQSQQKRKLKLDPKQTTSIVCTKFHSNEVVNFENAVRDLGRYFVEEKVTESTSHLVAGEPKRTINMLRAIARGCWILKHEWLIKSQKAGKWLNEEDYELTEFSPAVQQCRLHKAAFGPLYSMDIFKDCGYIYVGKSTTPKAADLKELISICKGKVTTVYRNASIVIGEYINREGITCVTEMWVLDSILFNKLKGFKHYLLRSRSPLV